MRTGCLYFMYWFVVAFSLTLEWDCDFAVWLTSENWVFVFMYWFVMAFSLTWEWDCDFAVPLRKMVWCGFK